MLGSTLKGMLLPFGALLFTTRRSRWDLMLMWFSVPLGGFSVWRYFTTSYELTGDELVIRTGLLSRNVRHIRYARVHNVETIQNPFHRLLRVAEVRVETAGSSEEEAKLSVLSRADADELRRRVLEGKRREQPVDAGTPAADVSATDVPAVVDTSPVPAIAADSEVLVRLGWRDLLAFGLTQNRGGLVVGAMLGIIWEADFLNLEVGRPTRVIGGFFEALWLEGRDLGHPELSHVAFLIGGVVSLLVLIRLFSLGWAIVQLYGFTLTRHGNELRSTRGLLTHVHSTIPVSRIQMVSVRQSPLMRACRRVEVRVQTAGGDKNATPGREWLAPSLRLDAVDTLVSAVLPGVELSSLEWQPAHAHAGRRYRRLVLRVIVVPIAAAIIFFPIPALVLAVPAVAFAWVWPRRHADALGHALLPDHVATRGGWLWKATSVARYAKVQAVTLDESPFDRRWAMADVSADTAGGGSHRITIPCLATGDARSVYTHLCAKAASTTFRW
jgi:putative membrane protein